MPLYPPSAQGTLSHIGPMTRTVRDAAMMMNVMARPDPRDLYGRPDDDEDYLKGFEKGVKELRIAYSPNLGFVERDKIDRDVAVAVENAVKVFKTLGARVVEDSPDLQGLDPRKILNAHWQSNVAILVKSFSEERRALMDPGLLKAAEVGANLGQEAVVTAIHQRQQVGTIMNQFMARYDLLLTPTMPMTAFAVNENAAWGGDGVDIGWTPFTLDLQPHAPARRHHPVRSRPRGPADRAADRVGPRARRAGAARRRRLRARAPDPGAAAGASGVRHVVSTEGRRAEWSLLHQSAAYRREGLSTAPPFGRLRCETTESGSSVAR